LASDSAVARSILGNHSLMIFIARSCKSRFTSTFSLLCCCQKLRQVAALKAVKHSKSRYMPSPGWLVPSGALFCRKHGHRWKSSFYHQTIFRRLSKITKTITEFYQLVGFWGAVPRGFPGGTPGLPPGPGRPDSYQPCKSLSSSANRCLKRSASAFFVSAQLSISDCITA
jgi:hypothetical protein